MHLLTLAALAIAPIVLAQAPAQPPSPAPVLDIRSVQDVQIVEVNLTALSADPQFCTTVTDLAHPCMAISRQWRLKDNWRERALELIRTTAVGGKPAASSNECRGPHHVILLETTSGKHALEFNFECNRVHGLVDGALDATSRDAWVQFFYSAGLVSHLPAVAR